MAILVADRVKETTTTTGTGTVTLAGAETNYQSFNSALSSGVQTYYAIVDDTNNDWETGIGTFTATSTLSRDSVLASTNSGSLVNFSAGTKDVFITSPAASAGFVGIQGPLLADSTVNNSATFTQKNVFGVAEFNVGGFTRATSGITVPYDGMYEVYVNCYFTSALVRSNVGVSFGVDSVVRSEVSASDYIRNTSGHEEASTNLKLILELTAGEEVNLFFAELSTSGTVNLQPAKSVYTIRKVD